MSLCRGSFSRLAYAAVFLLLFATAGTPAPAAVGLNGGAVCGNGIVEEGEECDDGGICIGGPRAGEVCQDEEACLLGGVCVGGPREGSQCSSHLNCPFGRCVRCRPFGGDGCAANCTREMDVPVNLIPGVAKGDVVLPGTSGIIVNSGFLNLGIAVSGFQTLRIGRKRDGRIPLAVRGDSVYFPRVSVAGIVCGCARGYAAKTCGGTLFEADGVTLSRDCTVPFTAGDAECVGRFPCAFVNGPGNSAAGEVGCNGLEVHNITLERDCGGEMSDPVGPLLTVHGAGGPGSAVMTVSTLVTALVGACTGQEPAMGPDGEFCTADDDLLASPSLRFTLPATTGVAAVVVHNSSNVAGLDLGPVSATGVPFSCEALDQGRADGATLVGVLAACDQVPLGDLVARSQLAIGEPKASPTPTPTGPTPTPTATPPLIRGDRRDPMRPGGCQVTWRVLGVPAAYDRFGLPSNTARCEDGNSACDFAPEVPGHCEFLVQVCLNVADPGLPSCQPSGVGSLRILRPRPGAGQLPVVQQALASTRFALQSAVDHLMDPARPGQGFVHRLPLRPEQRNFCSAPIPVRVVVGGRRKAATSLKVKTTNFALPEREELSTLRLLCVRPALRRGPEEAATSSRLEL